MILSMGHYIALMAFLKVVDHAAKDEGNRLRKVLSLLDNLQQQYLSLHTPGQYVSIDEQMVDLMAHFASR